MEKQYYISKEQFIALTAAWKASAAHSAAEHIIYNILRSKDAKLGFVERKRNIQGDSPWYAFKCALSHAQRMCSTANPWEKYKDTPHNSSYVRGLKQIIERKERFKAVFGIDLPEDIMDRLKEV